MKPVHPPFPTDCSLPFHPAGFAGIQTSISICESGVGDNTGAKRQYPGRSTAGVPGGAEAPGLRRPAGMTSAVEMVVSGRESDLKLSQSLAGVDRPNTAKSRSTCMKGRAPGVIAAFQLQPEF